MDFFRPGSYRNYSSNLYINKYAPKSLSEFKGNEGVRQTVASYIEANMIPNLLITGPHGSGKSLLAQLLVREYLGAEYMDDWCLQIYGSLSRGKDVVSEKQSVKNKQKNFNCPGITSFMKKKGNLPENKLRIVLIYEFNQMSPEAQMALRRIIELNSNRVRFIFLTEDHSSILQALQSRCTPLQMTKLDDEEMDSVLMPIIKKEGIPSTQEMLELIKINADGDIRVAVNLLQVLGETTEGNSKEWYDILGIPEIEHLRTIIKHCIDHQPVTAYRMVKVLLDQGFEISDLLDLISRVLVIYPDFPQKKEFIRTFCKDMLTIEECYTETQLYNLFNHFSQIASTT